MSYEFYKILHLIFVCCLFFSLGGLWLYNNLEAKTSLKKHLVILQGLSLLIIFISGFGLIAKLQVSTPWPYWVYIKITVWILLGLSPLLLKKTLPIPQKIRPAFSLIFFFAVLVIAIITVIHKPLF